MDFWGSDIFCWTNCMVGVTGSLLTPLWRKEKKNLLRGRDTDYRWWHHQTASPGQRSQQLRRTYTYQLEKNQGNALKRMFPPTNNPQKGTEKQRSTQWVESTHAERWELCNGVQVRDIPHIMEVLIWKVQKRWDSSEEWEGSADHWTTSSRI